MPERESNLEPERAGERARVTLTQREPRRATESKALVKRKF